MTRIYVRTFGCTANQADSEVLKGLLKGAGYKLVIKAKDSDLVIFNTCSLKSPTENRMFREINDTESKIVIAGCYPLSFPDDRRLKKYSLLGSFDFKRVVEAVEGTLRGERIVLLSRDSEDKLCLPRVRDDDTIAKIVISKGCLGDCSYCAGKIARGNLVSYSPDKIVEEAQQAVRDGCNRIYLTSQDCGCYGADIGTDIIELLERVLDIEVDFKVRMGMANPNHIYKLVPKLVEIYRHPKMLKFLHIPVQSGSDNILKLMNRQYSIAEFKEIVSKFRKEVPNITLSTDIIVGFPGETEEDFKETVELLKWLQPEVLNFTKYWPRKGTKAGDQDQLSDKVRKDRAIVIHELFENIKLLKKDS